MTDSEIKQMLVKEKGPDLYLNDHDIDGNIEVVINVVQEAIKIESIRFRTWMDNKGYFSQWKDGKAGYIRQENQIVFSPWRTLEEVYNEYTKLTGNELF